MASAAVDKRIESYRRLHIYGTKSRLYVIGHDEQLGTCRILKFRRQDGPRLDVVEDPLVYTPDQCNLVLRKVHEQSGGLQLICKGHGIIGCFRFTDSYYLLVVARREYVGHICGHKVYRIAETCLISLGGTQQRLDMAAADSTAEKRYRKLLLGVDLTKNFFFAYSYSLAHTLQHNHKQATAAGEEATAAGDNSSSTAAAAASGWDVYDGSMFVWNAYLTRPLRVGVQGTRWTLPLIHGYWEQRQVSVFGRQLTLSLLARRSRHFAGTRFRKRGLSAQGFVANEVETEQIVDAGIDWTTGQPLWSAMVQVRGSVPLFWSQQATPLSPKPDILLQQFDPIYEKTAAHFADLKRRYGNPIIALNLLKSKERRPREVLLRKEYAAAVSLLNDAADAPEQQVIYIPWDFQQHAKQPGANILLEINSIMDLCLNTSGIYVHSPASCSSCHPAIQQRLKSKSAAAAAADEPGAAPKQRAFAPQTRLQRGVLRTNCIDCLDRTNVVQFAYGLAAFGRQLSALGVLDDQESGVDSDSSIAFQLMEMYEGMGHTLALQYGGSEAHAAFFQKKRGEWEATTQSRDLMTSIRRFYSNAYTDAEKQDAINLFLGNYVPVPNAPPLWELDSDYYLHTDAAIRYSQLVCSDRLPAAATAAAAAFKAGAPTNAAAAAAAPPQVVTAGGRNAPVIIRQLSATTLPPSAFGFGSNVSSAAAAAAAATTSNGGSSSSNSGSSSNTAGSTAAGNQRPQPAWISPFAAAAASAVAADVGTAVSSSSGSTPLLPLTYSDGISIDACDTESSPNAAESAFNFKLVFQQMLSTPEQVPLKTQDHQSGLVSLDNVLAKLPRSRAVRLYPTFATRNNVMWEAVQQAFTFFNAEQVGDVAAAGGSSSSSSFIAAGNAGSFVSSSTAAAAAAGSDRAESSIQSLDLTAAARRQQQQQHASNSPIASSSGSSTAAAAAVAGLSPLNPSMLAPGSSQQLLDSPSKAAAVAAAAAAAASGQFLSAIGTLSVGLRSPPAPAVSNLNDILEIRTDVTPVRLISSASKPPQAICPQGPVLPAPATLDATLDELMWSQFGINISNMSSNACNNTQSSKPYRISRFSDLTSPDGRGLGGIRSEIVSRSSGAGFCDPDSPAGSSNQGIADRVWGGITTLGGLTSNVMRARGAAAAAAGSAAAAAAAGQKGLSPLNDILQVERSPLAAASGSPVIPSGGSRTAAAAGTPSSSVSLAGSPVKVTPHTAVAAATAAASTHENNVESEGHQYQHCPAGRVSFMPSGMQGYPYGSSSTSTSYTAAGSSGNLAAAAAAAAGATRVSPPGTPPNAAAAAAAGSSVRDTLTAAIDVNRRRSSSSTDPEWMVIDGHAVFVAKGAEQQQQQQQPPPVVSDTAAAIAAVSAATAYWNSPFKRSKNNQQQQQQRRLQHDSLPDPDLLSFTTAAALAAASGAAAGIVTSSSAAAAADQQQKQQQRMQMVHNMLAPVDTAAAAAAFGLCQASNPLLYDDLPHHHQQQQQQQQHFRSHGSSSGGSSSRVPSADVAGPTLQSWGLTAGCLGLNPEVQAVWWGLADLHEVWGVAYEGSCEAYRRYCRALLRLQDREAVEALQGWYEMQQFRTPVVIGAA